MKRTLFTTLLILLFVSTVYLPLSHADEASTWGLPEGAKLRLGRGSILDIAHVPDTTHLAVLTRAGIWLYDTTIGEAVDFLTLKADTGQGVPGNLQYSADGRIFAFISGSIVYLCNASTGETITTHEFEDGASGLQLSSDGQTFFIQGSRNFIQGSRNIGIIHVNASTGETIRIPANEGHGFVGTLQLSPDGTTYATQHGNVINLWDTSTHENIMNIPSIQDAVSFFDYSPDSTTVAVAYYHSGTDHSVNVHLYEVSTSEKIATLDFDSQIESHPRFRDIIFSAGGQIFIVTQSETVNLWAVSASETTLAHEFEGLYGGQLQSSPDGETSIIIHNRFNGTSIWDVSTGENIATLTRHTGQDNTSISFSPDGTSLASSGPGSVFLWDVSTAEYTARYFENRLDFTQSVSYSPDGTTLAVGGNRGKVFILNASTFEPITYLTLAETGGWMWCYATYSPDGSILATASDHGVISLWDASTFENITTFKGSIDRIRSFAFSPDGSTLTIVSFEGMIGLWDTSTFEYDAILSVSGDHAGVNSVAFSPDGSTLAIGSEGMIGLWNTSTFENIATLTGHHAWVSNVAFSPDGTTLASGSEGVISLWDTSTFENIATLTGHPPWVNSVAFSPDGTTLASGSSDGTILMWDLNLILGPADESANIVRANTPIRGPWLWMIASTAPSSGGAVSTDVDSLAVASGGMVTEADVAANGATEGDIVGDYAWTLAELPEESNVNQFSGNINQMLVTACVTDNMDINGYSSYALIVLESRTDQSDVIMRVGSDDSIKVWLNGSVVHTNAIDRGSVGFQDMFTVNLVAGDNLLLVKVSERGGAWKMFVGVNIDIAVKVPMVMLEPVYLVWDVNEDGQVNILDLVIVAQNIGSTAAAVPRADVNGDNKINVLDLVLVAAHFGESTNATAPISAVKLGELDPVIVEGWLALAQLENDGSLAFRQGIANLERLLALLIPQKTALLANYPNPFNPETWIPYKLASPADVSISIYAADGKLVRTLNLGRQPIGIYEHRSRAAHWDGKNAVGESVASGVYYYTLSADDFTATRKMLILK